MFKAIDCHSHINLEFFKEDYPEVLRRAFEAGVAVINIGTNKKDSEENIKIAKEFNEGVWAAAGVHPTEGEKLDYSFFKELAENEKVVAIGECGLDYFRIKEGDKKEKERQIKLFKEQIKLAKEVGKPLMLHLRTDEAYEEALNILEKEGELPGIIFHFYSGGEKFLERAIDLDAYFTFGGTLTFKEKNGQENEFETVLKKVPKEKILFETDAPFVAPEPYRGKRNEPIYVLETMKRAGEILRMSLEEICKIERENAERIFKIIL